ncbi:MAG: hypothetical protein V7603_4458 [Micromonosporaceae bacterium]
MSRLRGRSYNAAVTMDAGPGEPVRPRWRRLLLPAVFGVVIAVLGAVALALRAMGTVPQPGAAATPPGTRHQFAVLCAGPAQGGRPGAADDYCRRLVADIARRAPLDLRERALGEAAAETARSALPQPAPGGHLDRCATTVPGGPCRWVPDPPTVADVEQVRQALLAAGFREVTVRLARPDDPAPVDAVLYAVAAGPACAVGSRQGSGGMGTGFVAGRLADGSCLAP